MGKYFTNNSNHKSFSEGETFSAFHHNGKIQFDRLRGGFFSKRQLKQKGRGSNKRRALNVMKYCLRSRSFMQHHARSYQLNYDVLMRSNELLSVAQIDINSSRFSTLIPRIGLVECCFEHFFKYMILHPLVTVAAENQCVGARHTFAYVICCFFWRHKKRSFIHVFCRWWHYNVISPMHHIIINFNLGCALACLIDLSLGSLIYVSIVSLLQITCTLKCTQLIIEKIDVILKRCHCLHIQYLCSTRQR